jgi:hypothetical protein
LDPNEKMNLCLEMGETIGIPVNRIQAVRGARKGLADGVYRVTWAGTVDGDSPAGAARMALGRFYANLQIRPGLFIPSVQDKDGLVTQADLSGPKFRGGLQAAVGRFYAGDADSDEPVRVESEQFPGARP